MLSKIRCLFITLLILTKFPIYSMEDPSEDEPIDLANKKTIQDLQKKYICALTEFCPYTFNNLSDFLVHGLIYHHNDLIERYVAKLSLVHCLIENNSMAPKFVDQNVNKMNRDNIKPENKVNVINAKFGCKLCASLFADLDTFWPHLYHCHKEDLINLTKDYPNPEIEDKFNFWGKSCLKMVETQDYVVKNFAGVFKCAECDYSNDSIQAIFSHYKENHNGCAKCPNGCDGKFYSREFFYRHVRAHVFDEDTEKFRCWICTDLLGSFNSLIEHARDCCSKRIYICKLCKNCILKNYQDFATHMRNEHNKKMNGKFSDINRAIAEGLIQED